MLGWLNWLTTRASWCRRSMVSAEAWARTDLMATLRPRCGSVARNTLPWAPLPSSRSTTNRPMVRFEPVVAWRAAVFMWPGPARGLFAEIFGDGVGLGARLAEGDPAVLPDPDFLAPHQHLAAAFDGDVGAVGAAVGEHELVLAAFDGAVLARGAAARDHQAAGRVAAQGEHVVLAAADDFAVAASHAQHAGCPRRR